MRVRMTLNVYGPFKLPKKDRHKHFAVPVLGQSVSISTWLVPGPALCLDAGIARNTVQSFINDLPIHRI
jgi:hypothetical protein